MHEYIKNFRKKIFNLFIYLFFTIIHIFPCSLNRIQEWKILFPIDINVCTQHAVMSKTKEEKKRRKRK